MSAELAAIERLLRRSRSSVRRNPTWEAIHQETGAGRIVAGEIHFSAEDRQRLREYARSVHGIDPLFDARDGGRLAMARYDSSEKLAKDSVFGRLLVMATAGNAEIRVSGSPVRTPPGAVLSVVPEQLDADALKGQPLVVIENGALMPHWPEIRLPDGWSDAVLLYRGHRENQRAATELMAVQPSERLGLFFDFDPAGLVMALQAGKGWLFVPRDWPQLCRDSGVNQPGVHRQQRAALQQLQHVQERSGSGDLAELRARMESEELAVMQEHIVQRQLELEVLRLEDLLA
ncbi:DUF7281 domain-containing protein [Marinobacter profundi]|uniref:DUF7281 domain-containing protein n=1 Tax=Marinobacter profundi TaxID=2666256 RepID=A0A2G1UQW3_9GAMM|nr:hypothetical protein [Marinobacter profundi]PHQ16901.1 hypothetical protein CLH61_02755 [Marinobacter profundi]